jgi:hypothetical protein
MLSVGEVKDRLLSLRYIRDEIAALGDVCKLSASPIAPAAKVQLCAVSCGAS